MRYLIIPKDIEPFMTPYYNFDNNYVDGMCVYDLDKLCYTTDGRIWNDIPLDNL